MYFKSLEIFGDFLVLASETIVRAKSTLLVKMLLWIKSVTMSIYLMAFSSSRGFEKV